MVFGAPGEERIGCTEKLVLKRLPGAVRTFMRFALMVGKTQKLSVQTALVVFPAINCRTKLLAVEPTPVAMMCKLPEPLWLTVVFCVVFAWLPKADHVPANGASKSPFTSRLAPASGTV